LAPPSINLTRKHSIGEKVDFPNSSPGSWCAQVELGSKAGALRQMLLELLEDSDRIRRMTAMGRLCRSHRGSGLLECDGDFDEQEAEEEEEEVETLLEYYLQRSAPAA
jgi:hypothetical protein